MVTQKLPQEIKSKQSEIQILEETISNPNISREYLKDLQEQVQQTLRLLRVFCVYDFHCAF